MINLYLPPDFIMGGSLLENIYVPQNASELRKLTNDGKAILFPKKLLNMLHAPQNKYGGLLVTLGNVRPVKGSKDKTVIFSWNFTRSANQLPWGAELKVQSPPLSLDTLLPPEPTVLVRQRINRSTVKIPAETLQHDINTVIYAHSVLVSDKAAEVAEVHPSNMRVLRAMDIPSHLHTAVQNGLERHKNIEDERKERENALRDLMSSLPDGTPLIVRSNNSNAWQLGLKKGRMDVSLARNSMIAPTNLLCGKEMRAAGLSAHDMLPLEGIAAKARAEVPQACKFQENDPNLHIHATLHPHQPFHKSFMVGTRKKTAVAWMETDDVRATLASFRVIGENHVLKRGGAIGHGLYLLPYTNKTPHTVTIKEYRRFNAELPTLHNFMRIDRLWVVSEEVKDLMQQHQIGDVAFSPVSLLDIDGKAFGGNRFYISVDTPVPAAIPEYSDPDIFNRRFSRPVQPFEVTVNIQKTQGLDFWWDDTIRVGALFFSDRLYKALKRIKSMPRISAKPCAGV